jgi:hypothetical protein
MNDEGEEIGILKTKRFEFDLNTTTWEYKIGSDPEGFHVTVTI